MHTLLKLHILLLAVCLPLARTEADVARNDVIKQSGCQYADGLFERFIYFQNLSEPNITLSIATGWHHYAHDLVYLVPQHGFELVPPPSPDEYCNWKKLASVSVHGVHRGDITYKEDKTRRILYDPSYNNALLRRSTLVSSYGYRCPSNYTIHRSRNILATNSPNVDIAIQLRHFGESTAIAMVFTCCSAMLGFIAGRRSRKVLQDTEGIPVETVIDCVDPKNPDLGRTEVCHNKDVEFGYVQRFDVTSIKAGEVSSISLHSV